MALLALAGAAVGTSGRPAPVRAEAAPTKVYGLLPLPGLFAPTHYTPGSLDRADNIRQRVELVVEALVKSGSRGFGKPISLWVMAPEEWVPAQATRPYGLPELSGSILLVPAWGNEQTIALWTDLLGAPPLGDGSMPIRGTPEEAASLVPSDLLAQVEAARAAFYASGLRVTAPWVEDVVVHVVARAAFERHEPGRMAVIDAFFDHLISLGPIDASGKPVRLASDRLVSSIPDTKARLAAEGQVFALVRELTQGKAGKMAGRWIGTGIKYEGIVPSGEILKPAGAREAFAKAYVP